MKKLYIYVFILLSSLILTGCENTQDPNSNIQNSVDNNSNETIKEIYLEVNLHSNFRTELASVIASSETQEIIIPIVYTQQNRIEILVETNPISVVLKNNETCNLYNLKNIDTQGETLDNQKNIHFLMGQLGVLIFKCDSLELKDEDIVEGSFKMFIRDVRTNEIDEISNSFKLTVESKRKNIFSQVEINPHTREDLITKITETDKINIPIVYMNNQPIKISSDFSNYELIQLNNQDNCTLNDIENIDTNSTISNGDEYILFLRGHVGILSFDCGEMKLEDEEVLKGTIEFPIEYMRTQVSMKTKVPFEIEVN